MIPHNLLSSVVVIGALRVKIILPSLHVLPVHPGAHPDEHVPSTALHGAPPSQLPQVNAQSCP